jgi:hypothetical protein
MGAVSYILVNGHSGLATPVPISNTEVKQACVPASTVLLYGKPGSLFTLFFLKSFIYLG